MIAYAGTSQAFDSTKIANSDLRKAAKKLEQCKVDSVALQQAQIQNTILFSRLQAKEILVTDLQTKLTVQQLQLSNFTDQTNNCTQQQKIKDETIKQLTKNLKRQRARTRLCAISGVLTTAAVSFLFITH